MFHYLGFYPVFYYAGVIMEHTPNTGPKLDQSIARLKSVVTALESRVSLLIERAEQSEVYIARLDEQQHQLHVLNQQVATLSAEKDKLEATLTETKTKYEMLQTAGQDAQSQIDSAIYDLQNLLAKETIDS